MTAPWLTLAAIAALALLYVIAPIVTGAYTRYRRRRLVSCTETDLVADVQIDAVHAGLTAAAGPPKLRVQDCTLWPERGGCAQRCTAQL